MHGVFNHVWYVNLKPSQCSWLQQGVHNTQSRRLGYERCIFWWCLKFKDLASDFPFFPDLNSCSSSLKLSRLPLPDLRLTCVDKSGNKRVQELHHETQPTDARTVRRMNRLAKAITTPPLISQTNPSPPASFDFFSIRRDQRWSTYWNIGAVL